VDDVGVDARFNYPAHLALDTSETTFSAVLYVADYLNHAIRRVEVPYFGDGSVSTIAGTGTAGSTDGPGSIARFSNPFGIVIVSSSVYDPPARRIIYVAEHSGSRLRAVIPVPGNEPTQAGNYRVVALAGGVAGYLDGDGTTARFSAPHGIAAIATNKESTTLFVADYNNHRIRKVNVASSDLQSGVSGPAVPEPVRVVNWSSERPNQAAWAIDFSGFVSYPYVPGTLAHNTSTAIDVQFFVPQGIAGFSFTVYTEGDGSLINYPAQGASWLTTLGGDGTPGLSDGPGKLAQFNAPRGIVAVPKHLLPSYSPVYPSIRAFVADMFNSRIRYIDFNGNVGTYAGSLTGFADGDGLDARFNWPRAVAVAPDGSVIVADGDNHRIRRIFRTATGTWVTTIAGSAATGNADGRGDVATFSIPAGIAVDSGGTIYVTDSFSHIVRRIDRIGSDPSLPTSYQVVTVAGTAGSSGSTDATGAAARFNAPTGIAVGGDGRVYVADTNNHTVRLLTRATTTTMTASTLAGTAGSSGYVDATGAAARFNAPYGVTVDRANNVYVTDRLNYRVRRVNPLGEVKTLIGTGAAGFGDGPNGTLNSAAGIAVEPGGSLLIVDYSTHSVRVLQRIVTDAQF
jgi:sugar lactone lactonase YvrE